MQKASSFKKKFNGHLFGLFLPSGWRGCKTTLQILNPQIRWDRLSIKC
jgi:hypothetical protein